MKYEQFVKEVALPSANCIEYAMAGLAGEAGEVLGRWSKHIRDGGDESKFKSDLQKELGDVYWMWIHLHNLLDMDPGETIAMNIEKLESRVKRGVISGSGDFR